MSLLEQDITRKGRVHKKTLQPEFEDDCTGEKYEVEAICKIGVDTKEW